MADADPDHLAALFAEPAAGGSRGSYRPGRFDLRPGGGDGMADRLVHHHEAQHMLLTSTTAWGAALLLTTGPLFDGLLERCRTVQETYATYLSRGLAELAGADGGTVLDAYPRYRPLADRLDQFLAAVPGGHRRALAATAVARACMQTPILTAMLAARPEPIRFGALRRIDVPDERLALLLRESLPAEVVAAADHAAADGSGAVEADVGSGAAALDDRFDDAWAAWEDAVFRHLADRLTAQYDLSPAERDLLAGHDGPVVTVRTVADDGAGTGSDAVWVVRLPDPADVAALAAAWGDRGDLTCCVAASVLADAAWRDRWLPALRAAGPLVWLVDVGIATIAPELRGGSAVHSVYLDLGPSPAGASRAVAIKAEGVAGVWLALADELGVEMIVQQLADLVPGLATTGADWRELLPALRLVVLDLLRVEAYVDLRALTDHRG